jgi:hypothetical protein
VTGEGLALLKRRLLSLVTLSRSAPALEGLA